MEKFSCGDTGHPSLASSDPVQARQRFKTRVNLPPDVTHPDDGDKRLKAYRGSCTPTRILCRQASEEQMFSEGSQQGGVVVTFDHSQEEDSDFTSSLTMGRKDLENVIQLETESLYVYLKDLYSKGLEEAQAGYEVDKEAWEKRMKQLRTLLQQKDIEVMHLQQLIVEKEEELGQKDVHIMRQAELVGEQKSRIQQLIYQAKHLPSTSPRGHLKETMQRETYPNQVFSKVDLQASSHYVQLPQQSQYHSYREYDSCGFWQALLSSIFQHRKRWILGSCLALLLLLIILLATLIPASRKTRPASLRFIQPPIVSATGASFFDITVQLDQPSIISYMIFRTTDQLQQVPGTGKTLLDLIQSKEASGAAIIDAAAASNSLQFSTSQPGLQQLAVACGWAPVLNSNQNEVVSLMSLANSQSDACTATDVPRQCARCPRIPKGEDVSILMVAATAAGDAISSVQVLNAKANDVPLNINSVRQPFVSNLTPHSFVLNVWLNSPGTLYYVIQLESMFSHFGRYDLTFESAPPSSSHVMAAVSGNFIGGVVANGSFDVPFSKGWASMTIKPQCVYLSSVDSYGNMDPAPAQIRLSTPPDDDPPLLLNGTGPASITATSFDFIVGLDKAGGIYYMVLSAKSLARVDAPDVSAGSWTALTSLPAGQGRRLLRDESSDLHNDLSRVLHQASEPVKPGSLILPTCYPTNRTCQAAITSVFDSTPGLSSYDVISAGCMEVSAAGQQFNLPPTTNLENNTLYYMIVATEDQRVPEPLLQTQPGIYAIKTVDVSAPKFTCGFPTVTNISSSSMAVSVLLTKPSWAYYVVLPTDQAGSGPSAAEILQGKGPGGLQATRFGNFTDVGLLPWESGVEADSKKLWVTISGLQAGISYTVYVTLTEDGSSPVSGSPVANVADIFTPAIAPPTLTALAVISKSMNEASGTFSLKLNVALDRPGIWYYAIYRSYSCISGEPTISDIISGSTLSPSICRCSEPWYCSLVAAGSFLTDNGSQELSANISGSLAPLPFEELRDAPESQLRCFRGGIGQASDEYNIYIVAGSSLPTYNGLATTCANFAQAMSTAAAAEPSLTGTCPSPPSVNCNQAQSRPDERIMQSGSIMAWKPSSSSGGTVTWQPDSTGTITGRPAKAKLVLDGGEPPAFTVQPEFPEQLQLPDGLFMQFKLNKPALVVYAVRSFPVFNQETNDFPPPELVSTGRVPVFSADEFYNATIKACNGQGWPSGPLKANTQYTVQYVARDRYGRMDGPCPVDQPSCAAPSKTGRL